MGKLEAESGNLLPAETVGGWVGKLTCTMTWTYFYCSLDGKAGYPVAVCVCAVCVRVCMWCLCVCAWRLVFTMNVELSA